MTARAHLPKRTPPHDRRECGAPGPDGLKCQREAGHSVDNHDGYGFHAAHDGEVLVRW